MEEYIGKTRPKFEKNEKYHKPEVEDRVISLRNKGNSWEEITNIMRGELDEPSMSRTMTQKIYHTALAKTITTEKRAGKKFTDHTNSLNKMYSTTMGVLTRYVDAAEALTVQMEDMVSGGDITAVKAYGILLKSAPQMKAISSEIREYMKLQLDMQDKIKIEQKGFIYDEMQMLDEIEKVLTKLEQEGKIRWIKEKMIQGG